MSAALRSPASSRRSQLDRLDRVTAYTAGTSALKVDVANRPRSYSARAAERATRFAQAAYPSGLQPKQSENLGVASVSVLPQQAELPGWLSSLAIAQRVAVGAGLVGAIATLGLYGLTVKSQQAWSKTYNRLELLQRNERDLLAVNEALKHQLAQQAENPRNGLVPQNTNSTIFLPPTLPQRPVSNLIGQASGLPCDSSICAPVAVPVGY